MENHPSRVLCSLVVASAISIAPLEAAKGSFAELELRDELRLLTQRIRLLEQKLETLDPGPTPDASSNQGVVSVNEDVVAIASSDGRNRLRLRGTIQADSRWYLGAASAESADTFVLRRARILMEGVFSGMFQYQIVPEFGGGGFNLVAANVSAVFSPALQVRLGRFKQSVGLEHLQADSSGFFIERSLVSNLVPGVDIGLQFSGDLAEGRINYALGLFNGSADSTNANNLDSNDAKAVAGRLILRPIHGFGIGLGASLAPAQEGKLHLPAGYRTEGQQRFFAYGADVISDGQALRLSPQAFYYAGSLGVLAEYVRSEIEVRKGLESARLAHDAWQVAVGYVLTGEDASYTGVAPARPFAPSRGDWGAFEVVARFSQLNFDDETFPRFALPSENAAGIRGFGGGVNWFLSSRLRFTVDYLQSRFSTRIAPSSLLLLEGEKAVLTRLQLLF